MSSDKKDLETTIDRIKNSDKTNLKNLVSEGLKSEADAHDNWLKVIN